jgi:hypothetical protein
MLNPFATMLAEIEEAIRLLPHHPDEDAAEDREAEAELNAAIAKFIGTADFVKRGRRDR